MASMVSNPNHHPTTHQCLTGKLRCHVVEGGQLRGDVVDMSQLRRHVAQPLRVEEAMALTGRLGLAGKDPKTCDQK